MSQWTHVNGNVRIDALRVFPKFPSDRQRIEEKLGIAATVEPYNGEVWDKCKLPMGSEGSVEYFINENPMQSALSAFSVSFWGDLRDFGEDDDKDVLSLQTWFENLLDGEMVRQAILEIDIESKGTVVFLWQHRSDADQGKLVKIIDTRNAKS